MLARQSLRPLTRDEVRGIDQRAIDEFGLSGLVLMENAGRNAAMIIAETFAGSGRVVGIVCGKGNNAGDGFVIARHLEVVGFEPQAFLIENPKVLSHDAKVNYEVVVKSGLSVTLLENDDIHSELLEALSHCDIVIDALIGTGLRGSARGRIADGIRSINDSRAANENQRIVSIDIPSGMDCDHGVVSEETVASNCVIADLTITFVSSKVGFSHPTARTQLGELRIAGIGAPMVLLREYQITALD